MVKARGNETVKDFGPRFDWEYKNEQDCIFSQFYGLTLIALPSGLISELLGPWHVLFWSSIAMAVFSAAIVPLAHLSWIAVFMMRFFIGIMLGLQYPAMQCLIGRWAPPQEKGKFSACLMGNAFGVMITLPVMGMIIEYLGWAWSFYSLSFFVFLYCLGLVFLVADYPKNYRWMDPEELEFIEGAQGQSVSKEKRVAPYAKIFMSIPFWAAVVAQFGNQFGLFMQITVVAQFMKRAMGFNLKDSAGIAAIPPGARLVSGFAFGAMNDFLLNRGVKKAYARKGFTIASHILTGLSLCFMFFLKDHKYLVISMLVLMMIFNGAAVVTVLINPQDLSPNFAGTLYGIMNFFGGFSGIIIPALVKSITTEKNEFKDWAIVFCIGGSCLIASGIIFIIFGSVEIQKWNEKAKQPDETTTEEERK